jgi:precorrin-2 methylase
MKDAGTKNKISNTVRVSLLGIDKNSLVVLPNPVTDNMHLRIFSTANNNIVINVYDEMGKIVSVLNKSVQKGENVIINNCFSDKPKGIYQVVVLIGGEILRSKILVVR